MKALVTAVASCLLLAAPVAHAQDAAACAPLPPVWAGWGQTQPLTASTTAGNAAIVKAGQAYAVSLNPGAQVMLASGHPGKDGSFAGMLGFDVTVAGVYTVALDQGAWVDVAGTAGVLRSVSHAKGEPCTGIHKLVDFQLEPGHYTVQLSSAPQAAIRMEVQPK